MNDEQLKQRVAKLSPKDAAQFTEMFRGSIAKHQMMLTRPNDPHVATATIGTDIAAADTIPCVSGLTYAVPDLDVVLGFEAYNDLVHVNFSAGLHGPGSGARSLRIIASTDENIARVRYQFYARSVFIIICGCEVLLADRWMVHNIDCERSVKLLEQSFRNEFGDQSDFLEPFYGLLALLRHVGMAALKIRTK